MKFYKGINRVEMFLVAIVTVALVFVVFFQVINRTIVKASFSWPEEAARYLMIWQVFLASAIAFRKGANCCIDVLVKRFHGWGVVAISMFSNIMCVLFATTIIVTAVEVMKTQITFNQTSTALNINMAFVYAALPVWGMLFIVELVFMTLQLFQNRKGGG